MVGISKRLLSLVVVLALGALLLPLESFAASTGQIKGRLTDRDSGEPVIGATVMVVGTSNGAMSDLDGNFAILRLEPGVYTVKISSVEYRTVEVTDVDVKIDETFEVNQKLDKAITELEEVITVIGQAPIIDKFVTTSQVSISQDEIKSLPVATVDNLLDKVAGVQTTAEGEVFIRGGRAGEVAYIVDGVPLGDPIGGSSIGASLSLVSGSISEIQIIKDGFDPEYGNALSGVINIRNLTGNKDNTVLNLKYITDDLGNRDMNKYSRNQDNLVFSLSGPDPILSSRILPALGITLLKDQEFTYYLYFEMDKNDGFHKWSDYDTQETKADAASYNILGFELPERAWNQYNVQFNTKFRPKQNLKFVASYKRWYTKAQPFDWRYRYSAATAPVIKQDREAFSLEVTHAVSKDMNYEMIVSMTDLEYTEAPGDPIHPGKTVEPDDFDLDSQVESFQDKNGNGVYDAPEPIINLYPDTASYGTNFTGPGYTYGEGQTVGLDSHGNIVWFNFNNNGIIDYIEGEPYLDLNGNGVWDEGDDLNDKNGNGILDRVDMINNVTLEPFVDGDLVLGEPFYDLNFNGVYDEGVDEFYIDVAGRNQDLNHNGQHDGPEDGWSPGVPFMDRNGNGIYDAPNNRYDVGEAYTDLNGNGVCDRTPVSFLDPGSFDEDADWTDYHVRTYRGEFKVVRQMGRHEVKSGVFFQRDEVDYGHIEQPYMQYTGRPDTTNAYVGRGAFRDFYAYKPFSGAVYFRDKIEYGSMIASLGLRWDFFLQDVNELAATLRQDDRGGLVEGDRHKFSPRIGFSYPISDKAKVYFNYGHFFQLPGFARMYARNTVSANQADVLGNPNLTYEKTIQYSFGVKYAMSESYSVDVEGYFKDEFDKINSGVIYGDYLQRQQFLNKDYGRSRGFEITLEKRGGGYVNGSLSYTYAYAYGKASKTNEQFQNDLVLSREPLTESPLDHDIRHSVQAGVQVYMPNNVKPRLFGIPIPNGWSLSLESIVRSGKPFTPDAKYPYISQSGTEDIETNSLRYPGTAVFDARFSKEFKLVDLDWQFIVWVENIFDSKNVTGIYTNTGRPDTRQLQYGVVEAGTPYDLNPDNWDYGRQIRLGIEVSI